LQQNLELETTKDLYFRDGAYTPQRRQIHENIVDQALSSVQPAQQQPLVVFLGGGSASGKSTIVKRYLQKFKNFNEGILLIDSDKIKTMLPEYQKMVETDPKNAANRLHDESSDIATKMYEAGLRNKVNMILDGTIASQRLDPSD
jgi:adenylylsulfate kinase-like enzyme